jgi:hypothetical protein
MIKDHFIMQYSVLLSDCCTWVDVVEYRVWLNEFVSPGRNFFNSDWEVTMRADKQNMKSNYVINFRRPEDATAFKLRFSI